MNKKSIIVLFMACLIYVQTSIAANKFITEHTDNLHQSGPTLSFRFEIQHGNQTVNWYLDRKPDAIATFNENTKHAELWIRDATGAISHNRVFSNDKKIIEYTNGELKTLNKVPHWEQLASVLDAQQLAQLKLIDSETHFGKPAKVYAGSLNGMKTKICWIPELQIPAYIEQGEGKDLSKIVLKEVFQTTPVAWQWVNADQLNDYTRIDASDLGDMETDPFVKRLHAIDEHHQGQHQH